MYMNFSYSIVVLHLGLQKEPYFYLFLTAIDLMKITSI